MTKTNIERLKWSNETGFIIPDKEIYDPYFIKTLNALIFITAKHFDVDQSFLFDDGRYDLSKKWALSIIAEIFLERFPNVPSVVCEKFLFPKDQLFLQKKLHSTFMVMAGDILDGKKRRVYQSCFNFTKRELEDHVPRKNELQNDTFVFSRPAIKKLSYDWSLATVNLPKFKQNSQELSIQEFSSLVFFVWERFFSEKKEIINSKTRKQEVIFKRYMNIGLCREIFGKKFSWRLIGLVLCEGFNHASILHANRVHKNLLSTDREYSETYNYFRQIVFKIFKKNKFSKIKAKNVVERLQEFSENGFSSNKQKIDSLIEEIKEKALLDFQVSNYYLISKLPFLEKEIEKFDQKPSLM